MQTGFGGGMPMSNLSAHAQMNNGSKHGGSGLTTQDAKLKHFAGLLCEFSKYNSDLKAILENSKSCVGQNQNQHSGVNPYANNGKSINPFLNNNGNYDSTGNPASNSGTNFKTVGGSNNKINNAENENSTIESNVSSSRSEYITPDSIYNLLTARWTILIDTSKLPDYLQKIVNKLVNNNDLNNPSNNQSGDLITGNTLFSSNNMPVDNQKNKQNKQQVPLNADKFQDLIYYFIINTVAKEKGIDVLLEQNQGENYNNDDVLSNINQNVDNAYSNAKQRMQGCFSRRNNQDANQIYSDYRKSVGENPKLRNFIENKEADKNEEADKKSESNNFWRPFLWGVLKRASFLISLYNLFTSGQNRRKYAIDTVLGSSHVLLLVSLIFGWGAIANTILFFIALAVVVYDAVNKYKPARHRYLLYALFETDTFHKMAEDRSFALVSEVGDLYKFYNQNAAQIAQQEQSALRQKQRQELYDVNKQINSQFPSKLSSPQPNPFGPQLQHQNFPYSSPHQGQNY